MLSQPDWNVGGFYPHKAVPSMLALLGWWVHDVAGISMLNALVADSAHCSQPHRSFLLLHAVAGGSFGKNARDVLQHSSPLLLDDWRGRRLPLRGGPILVEICWKAPTPGDE